MKYIDRLKLPPKGTEFAEFRSMRAKLALVVHSRPGIACTVAFASQVTENTYDNESLNKISKNRRGNKRYLLEVSKARHGYPSFCNLLRCIVQQQSLSQKSAGIHYPVARFLCKMLPFILFVTEVEKDYSIEHGW